jgi:hypothetical protein
VIDDEKEVINIEDQVYFEPEEYSEMIENPIKFIWTKLLPRKYKKLRGKDAFNSFQYTINEFLEFSQYNLKITEKFIKEYQVPTLMNIQGGVLLHPLEMLFNFFRGIKGLSLDIRRNREQLLEAIAVLEKMFVDPALAALDNPSPPTTAFDAYTAFLAHSILSPKQFGELYWPTLKKIIDKLVATNKKMYIFSENTMLQFYEYFQDVPKGYLVIHVELDDIFEARKKLPNICFAGGMPADLLGYADEQTCVDYAKKLIDNLGRDGGYYTSKQVYNNIF